MENSGTSCSKLVFLGTFGEFYGYLVYFVVNWYIFSASGTSYQEKSGNPIVPRYRLALVSWSALKQVLVWRSGHIIRLTETRLRVRIPAKDFGYFDMLLGI
jgi:hypothetical protein